MNPLDQLFAYIDLHTKHGGHQMDSVVLQLFDDGSGRIGIGRNIDTPDGTLPDRLDLQQMATFDDIEELEAWLEEETRGEVEERPVQAIADGGG